MLLLADLLVEGLEESLFSDSTDEAALRFIILTNFNLLLINFEESEIGGCWRLEAGIKLNLKFVLQLVVWLQKQLMFKFAASWEQLIAVQQQHKLKHNIRS